MGAAAAVGLKPPPRPEPRVHPAPSHWPDSSPMLFRSFQGWRADHQSSDWSTFAQIAGLLGSSCRGSEEILSAIWSSLNL